MSGGGRKKSGFQITSVTSDYEQKEGRADPKAGPAEAEGDGGLRANGGNNGVARNGPSAPTSPLTAPPFAPSLVSGSRFRVVKLDPGPGEPYKRGRWTCRDFYDPEAEPHHPHPFVGRLAEAGRHPQSLDSRLEVAGLLAHPQGPFSPQPQRRGVVGVGGAYATLQSQLVLPPATSGHQARSVGGGLPVLVRPHRTPPSPASLRSPLAVVPKEAGDPGTLGVASVGAPAVPTLVVEEHLLPKSVAQLIQRETDERRKVSPRQSRSRPSSPAPPLFRDASPNRRTSDPFGSSSPSSARFSLAQSMFGIDSDDDSGTNSSMIAIDNKIEQAMDLVKSHLMFAVREEVEVLREQIKELSERNALLEQENALLRSLANSEQLSRFQAQLHSAAKPPPPPPPSSGTSA
ncbi:TSC22 domain family protein 4 [Anolis carolinensis]|uniref:TSC22 domain family protein 4 n=1 Tax=Anolis carolinensis TaxID=28377 RepID=UPI002F2B7730